MKVNGSLVFDASSASEIQNLRVEKVATNPTHNGGADQGRVIYNTTLNTTYIGGTVTWVAIATGGNAAALQTEVDAIETSLGGAINSDGTFNAAGFPAQAGLSSPTSFTNAINQLAAYATSKDQLSELSDVAIVAAANKDFLMYDGTKWVDHVLVAADLTDVTATAAELNKLTGVTASTTELNYVTGVTSGIQSQLANKQPLDATLTSLAAMTGTGIIVETGIDTFSHVSLTAPAAGITISNADGVAGSPTFALANDLAALEGLTTSGYVVRTGDGTATTRSLAVIAGDLVITGDASGVSTDTTFGLGTVTQANTGSFVKVTLDSKGRVTGNTAVTTSDITSLVDTTYVNVAGDTMTGSLVMGSGTKITLTDTPSIGTDAANKAYVDAIQNGLSWKAAVVVATNANIALDGTATAIDGVTLVSGMRVLVKSQTAPAQNGIYIASTTAAWVRSADMNDAAEFDGSAVFVQQGTLNEGSGWTETQTVTTVGTSAVSFSQFSGGQAFIWGVGLGNTGNTIFVNMGAGIAQLPSDEVGLDIVSGKAVQLTGTATGDQLTFVLDGAGLEQSASGLKISAAGVTNAMLANNKFVINADSGTDATGLVLGDTLEIKGTSTQGIVTAVTESPAGTSTFTITASNAASSQKGVASFDSSDFTVTAGHVVIAAAGVDNAQLANSSVSFSGTTGGAQAVSLGGTLSVIGGSVPVSTVSSAGTVTINVADATTSTKGLASFSATDFSVTSGAVSLVAKNLDSLSDVVITSPASGQAVVYNGTNFVNTKVYHLHTQGTAATTWSVSHQLGQKYCNVTVVDSTDNVVIPQSIVFDSTTGLTVTFNTAIQGKVIVMGIA